MTRAWIGCADRARARDDPLIGSAPHAEGWLLIEHPGAWRRDALAGTSIDRDVLRELSGAAQLARWRILLIRRPGRSVAPSDRRWIAVGRSRTRRGSWRTGDDLRPAVATLRALAGYGPEHLTASPNSSDSDDPILLVCTHGTRDTCCAIRGRAVSAALAARWPEWTWECSHVGGDRFAANLVVLPDAAYYGSLDKDTAVRVVAEHLNGRLALDRLRGLARFPPVEQAAIAEAHRQLGPLPPTAVTAGVADQLGPHRWQVAVSTPHGRYLALVQTEPREPAVLTCQASTATPATSYRVLGLRLDPDPVGTEDSGRPRS